MLPPHSSRTKHIISNLEKMIVFVYDPSLTILDHHDIATRAGLLMLVLGTALSIYASPPLHTMATLG